MTLRPFAPPASEGFGCSAVRRLGTLTRVPTQPLPVDPIAEARRLWMERWGVGEHMAAATSLMRAQQLVLAAVEDVLRPYGLTFSSYEALMLLTFSRHGSLPLGKMSERLMVHPASITNTVDRLEERGFVARRRDSVDGRRVLAVLTPAGRAVAAEATGPLNDIQFGLSSIGLDEAEGLNAILRLVREAGGDFRGDVDDPWRSTNRLTSK
jgi:DNA-binding MarR family transcriptional regulator